MQIDPAVIIGFLGALLTLLGLILRAFVSGSLLSTNVVPRPDYDRLVAINADYAEKFGEQTKVIALQADVERQLAADVKRLANALERLTSKGAT